jgi:nucleotide-binding universal stress UspA family protein
MSYKNIMVHLGGAGHYVSRLELAVTIAKTFNAHLTGLFVVSHQPYKPELEVLGQRIAEIEAAFRVKTGDAGIDAHWLCADWHMADVGKVEMINHYAHAQDLVIVGQTPPDHLDGDYPKDLPERVVLGSGRPVLVVPYVGSFPATGNRVIVAWKSGRASARAVNDAMPFLVAAKEVRLLDVRSPDEQVLSADAPGDGMASSLRRHGITVKEEHLVSGNIPVENILMNYAWENGCDLVVMGAFSSTKRGTVTLGPVASEMLDHMTLPVLLSN